MLPSRLVLLRGPQVIDAVSLFLSQKHINLQYIFIHLFHGFVSLLQSYLSCTWTTMQMRWLHHWEAFRQLLGQPIASSPTADRFSYSDQFGLVLFVSIICFSAAVNKLKSVSKVLLFFKVKSHGASLLNFSFSSLSSATAAAISCLCLSLSSRRIALNCVLVYNNFLHREMCCRSKTTITQVTLLAVRRASWAPITDWLYCLFNWQPGEQDTVKISARRTQRMSISSTM